MMTLQIRIGWIGSKVGYFRISTSGRELMQKFRNLESFSLIKNWGILQKERSNGEAITIFAKHNCIYWDICNDLTCKP